MELYCLACGVEKDTSVKEFYMHSDRLIQDIPIDPLFVLCVEGRKPETGWRQCVVCHACFERLDPDMWISSDCWLSLDPIVPFSRLPAHRDNKCGRVTPEELEDEIWLSLKDIV